MTAAKRAAGDGLRAAGRLLEREPGVRLAVAVDDTVDPQNRAEVLWRLCNNIDAGRDLRVVDGRVALDATTKRPDEGLTRPWPEDITMSPQVRALVDRRWAEYEL